MAKIAIVTDSNSAITQAEAKELGVYVLPMPFMIDDETLYEDIDLTQEEFYEKLKNDVDIKTSQPEPGSVTDLWDELLKEYDEIVHIPMSSGLSSSCETAIMLSREDEYDGKVFVVNNQRISVTQKQSVLDAMELVKRGLSGSEIRDFLEKVKLESSIYIMLDTLYYLKKGGRITPAAAALGTLLKIKPVLQIQGEKLDSFAKARTAQAGIKTMKEAIRRDIEGRFGGTVENTGCHIEIAYSQDEAPALRLKEELMEEYPNCGEIIVNPLSLSVSCHIGPGALAIAVSKKIPE